MADILPERFDALMKMRGLSQSALARVIGVSQPTIGRIVSGETRESGKLIELARALRTSPEYLIGEVDDPDLVGSLQVFVAPSVSKPDLADELDLVPVREVDLALGMGATFLEGPHTERIQHFPRSWLRNFTHSHHDDLFFAIAVGDSMKPTMMSGDIVLIDRRQSVVDHADLIWAFSFGGMGMVKRLGPASDGRVEIISDNPDVKPKFAMPDELHVMGRVVAIVRKM